MALKIRDLVARDIRFPTSRQQDGSDALNQGDYSATYVVLETDEGLRGHGLTFTNGRGNEIVRGRGARAGAARGRAASCDDIIADMRGFFRSLTQDEQLRWLGPEKGILHMATGAVINAVWDLWARRERQAAVEAARGPDRRSSSSPASTSPTSPTPSRPRRRSR